MDPATTFKETKLVLAIKPHKLTWSQQSPFKIKYKVQNNNDKLPY